ncbi:MAG: alpha-glucan family phosphorylase [Rikenellaceae bacterium]
MSDIQYTPDYLFEISWEVCNKVGGIHTVIATKALTVSRTLGEGNYIVIGPDFARIGEHPEFEEDETLFKAWRLYMLSRGLRVRVGHWKIVGRPIAILVDFTCLFSKKDRVLAELWESYQVDSITGRMDYVESALFGYGAGIVVSSFTKFHTAKSDKVVAHFHEWMTATGGLYLRLHDPRIATVFSTHATVMGRCIAGNRLPLYNELNNFNSDELAHRFNVVARHSVEKAAAHNYDAFATVSDITAAECKALLSREVDVVTPNGFEDDIVWKGKTATTKRKAAREKMIAVAESLMGFKYKKEPLIIGTSGRYEFRNKGIDIFIESLKALAADPSLDRDILVYVTVPAGDKGARRDLQACLADPKATIDPSQSRNITHYIDNPQWDQTLGAISGAGFDAVDSKIKLVFVPAYLNSQDGIFNMDYYEVLVGMDLTVYASYYEPWGYTPLESAAFSVPTITTTLAGFGIWVAGEQSHEGVRVIKRDDYNDGEVIGALASAMLEFSKMSDKKFAAANKSASDIASTALWSNLFEKYKQAYSTAINNSLSRIGKALSHQVVASDDEYVGLIGQTMAIEQPNWTRLMVEKSFPERLHALEELSRNLWWCWNVEARNLFESIDPEMWAKLSGNPIALLDSLSLQRVQELGKDKKFLANMDTVYAEFQEYMAEEPEPQSPNVAYFSMEFGLHSSLKIYSGGLGILAGDYIKEASDRNVPMAAVGLLYRYGYFTQKLSAQGAQEASYEAQDFQKLPITPVRDEAGNWITVSVDMPGRTVYAHVWKCPVGRVGLYLLDTDIELNLPEDRNITHHLYGGDWENRLKQEMVLGLGGIRALEAMGIQKQVYHCNEGHAAFIGLERMRQFIENDKLNFSQAVEVVRSTSLFTTHTPVPAGHDAFPESMIHQYMPHFHNNLGISWEQFLSLGKTNVSDPNERFSMSVLACNLSQEVNGVSWLHGEVSKDLLGYMWPGYFKSELHISYVTNGVHFPTWVAANMRKLYAKYFESAFTGHTYNIPDWQKVHDIPDADLWEARVRLKKRLIKHIRNRYEDPSQVKFDSPSQIVRIIEGLKPEVLTIGFARRFATYKRAHLLFTNLERLDKLVNNPERPVQFVFAGKAHPNDKPGQDLIKRIVEVSMMPQFLGKILFMQNYDMDLARHMVQGVDVWLNTPTRPLEASGTSGEKCVMNGVLQFSVLDGWWVEGYREDAGWMLPMERTFTDQRFQDELDAEKIYTTIEEQIAPLYYTRFKNNMPVEWLKYVKNCIADVASNFTMNRMIIDYEERFYNQLAERNDKIRANGFAMATEVADWKKKINEAWGNVKIVDVQRASIDNEAIHVGKEYHFEVTVDTATLSKEDIGVELLVANQIESGQKANILETVQLEVAASEGTLTTYSISYVPTQTGVYDVALRIYPKSDLLPHRMDMPLVKWA